MPKVSVIIPNYNHASYLEKRVSSIMNQGFKDFEVFLLDDASTDNSQEVISAITRDYPQIKTILNESNSGGPFFQWNKGAQLAQGEYLWFAESDDYCESNFLESLVPLLDSNPKVGIAYAQSYLVDEEDKIINSYQKNLEFIYKSEAWRADFIKNGKDVCKEWLLFHNPIPNASGALMRRNVFLDCGMAEPQMILNGDWHLYTKMLSQSDLAFKADHLNYFRVHASTQRQRSRSSARVYKEIISINEFIKTAVPDSSENAVKAIRKVSTWWQGNLYFQSWNKENLRLNRELYRYFSAYRSWLPLHIVYTFTVEITRSFLRFTGLLKPAKKLRSQLFPGKYFDQ